MNQRTFARRRSARAHRTLRAAGWLASSLLAITAALGPAVGSVAAASVEPIAINSGNPTCDDFAGDAASWSEIKLQDAQLADGTYTDGVITITISNFVGSSSGTAGSFDWASDLGVDAVFVKAGSSRHQLYVYDPEATSDTGLRPQAGKGNGISHLSICYDADPTGGPTQEPTEDPSEQPTEDPSEQPTEDPSEQPTEQPSENPSEQPSEDPTQPPTEDPTEQPTEDPTEDPSEQPTEDPSEQPTEQPTEDPSEQPTEDPSEDPSEQPAEDPSQNPTDPSTETPTDDPVEEPTDEAIDQPTDEPTDQPAEQVSDQDGNDPDGGSSGLEGAVLGTVGGPTITPPPTDALPVAGAATSPDAWRPIFLGLSLLLAGLLLAPRRATRRR
jgi:hypothetical protein